MRKLVAEGTKATLIDESDKWYNAFDQDIAVANFFFTKPTAIGATGLIGTIFMSQIYFRVQEDGEHGVHRFDFSAWGSLWPLSWI